MTTLTLVDFRIERRGSVFVFYAQSPQAKEEILRGPLSKFLDSWQRVGRDGGFIVDQGVAGELASQLHQAGFTLR